MVKNYFLLVGPSVRTPLSDMGKNACKHSLETLFVGNVEISSQKNEKEENLFGDQSLLLWIHKYFVVDLYYMGVEVHNFTF